MINEPQSIKITKLDTGDKRTDDTTSILDRIANYLRNNHRLFMT